LDEKRGARPIATKPGFIAANDNIEGLPFRASEHRKQGRAFLELGSRHRIFDEDVLGVDVPTLRSMYRFASPIWTSRLAA
jgi:hypothetical protein